MNIIEPCKEWLHVHWAIKTLSYKPSLMEMSRYKQNGGGGLILSTLCKKFILTIFICIFLNKRNVYSQSQPE